MALSDEERRRIYEEEKTEEDARAKVRSKKTKTGCLKLAVVVTVFVVCAISLSSYTGDELPEADSEGTKTIHKTEYSGGLLACSHAFDVFRDLSQGFLTDAELRQGTKEFQSDASHAEPDIRAAADAALRAATLQKREWYIMAASDLIHACVEFGYFTETE